MIGGCVTQILIAVFNGYFLFIDAMSTKTAVLPLLLPLVAIRGGSGFIFSGTLRWIVG